MDIELIKNIIFVDFSFGNFLLPQKPIAIISIYNPKYIPIITSLVKIYLTKYKRYFAIVKCKIPFIIY